jgi:general secretion pathway protein C
MLVKLITFFIWIGVSASTVQWGLKVYNTFYTHTQAPAVTTTSGPYANWSRILGEKKAHREEPQPSISAAQFKLLGLAAATQSGVNQGIALISFQDQPPRSYKVGAVINENLKVLDISNQKVTIGSAKDPQNQNEFIYLEAVLLPKAATSKEPPSGTSGSNAAFNSSPKMMPPIQPEGRPYDARPPYYTPSPPSQMSNPSYNTGNSGSRYQRRSAEPPPGMNPRGFNPETNGTQGYPSPPPTDNPMY